MLPQVEKHEVTVRLILVDVIPTDQQENVVKDLTIEEFELYEGGKRVPINSLDFVSLDKETSKAPQVEVRKAEYSLPFKEFKIFSRRYGREFLSGSYKIREFSEIFESGSRLLLCFELLS